MTMEFPLSSSLSTTLIPGLTQEPTSIEDSPCRYGISLRTAEKWKREYNRQTIPIMDDKVFCGLIVKIARDHDPAVVSSVLESSIKKKSTHLLDNFNTAKYEMLLPGAEFFSTEFQKMDFISVLSEEITIHSFLASMTNNLPYLIEASQNVKPKRQKQNARPRRKRNAPQGVSKPLANRANGTSMRRSLRIAKLKKLGAVGVPG